MFFLKIFFLSKDICEGVASQVAEVGVAHQRHHQRLFERFFGKSPQLLQPERTLSANVGWLPVKESSLRVVIAPSYFRSVKTATAV